MVDINSDFNYNLNMLANEASIVFQLTWSVFYVY